MTPWRHFELFCLSSLIVVLLSYKQYPCFFNEKASIAIFEYSIFCLFAFYTWEEGCQPCQYLFFTTQAREFLSKLGDLSQTQIFAKIENVEVFLRLPFYLIITSFYMFYHRSTLIALQGLNHFDEILAEADGIIMSRGNLGIDLPPEKVVYLIKLFCSAPHLF